MGRKNPSRAAKRGGKKQQASKASSKNTAGKTPEAKDPVSLGKPADKGSVVEDSNEDNNEDTGDAGVAERVKNTLNADDTGPEATTSKEATTQEDAGTSVGWMSLEHPGLASAEARVQINNLEHLAIRMNNIEELIRAMGGSKIGRRPRSASSASSRTSLESTATRGEEEKEASKVIMGDDFAGLIRDQHHHWMEESNRKILVVKTKSAKADAKEFFIYLADIALPELFGDDWPTHPLEALLPVLGDESHIEIFIDLNKDLKSSMGPSEPKSALKSDNKRKKKGRVQTLSKDSQRTEVDLLSDDRVRMTSSSSSSSPPLPAPKRARTNVVIESEDEESQENTGRGDSEVDDGK